MLELFSEWVYPFKEFHEMVRNDGFLLSCFRILIYVVLTLVCLPFCFVWVVFSWLNEKSKDFFK